MTPDDRDILGWRPRLTVRLRLTLSYAGFLVFSGAVVCVVAYLVMRWVPDYPLYSIQHPDMSAPARGEILDTLVRLSGGALLILAAIGLAGGWFLAGRMLRPLQQINEAARRAATGELDHRLGLSGRDDEFKDLADTFDHMLDRLQASLREHRRFAANASHELRTPQAVTKMMLEVAMADPANQDHAELIRRLHDTNERGIGIVDTLLTLADLDHRPPAGERVDLATTASEAAEELFGEADQRGVRVSMDLDAYEVAGNPLLIRQLVTNVMQNAIRHNLPSGGSVTVRTGIDPGDPGRVLLVVRNTGEVLPRELVARLAEPFVRGRGRLADGRHHSHGHGLGLALVSRIAAAHGGTLGLAGNPGGGLTVTVALPRFR